MWSYARRGARVPSLEGAGSGAGSSTQPCDWSGVLYTVGLVDAPRLMPIRPRLTRPPRILIASDQNHALSDVVRSLGRRGYSGLERDAGVGARRGWLIPPAAAPNRSGRRGGGGPPRGGGGGGGRRPGGAGGGGGAAGGGRPPPRRHGPHRTRRVRGGGGGR